MDETIYSIPPATAVAMIFAEAYEQEDAQESDQQ